MTTFRVDQTSLSTVVQQVTSSSGAARRARLDRLKQAVQDYVTQEKKRIEDEVAALQAILSGRTGGQGLSKYPAQAAARFAYSSMSEFLAGRPIEASIELPTGSTQQPELPSPIAVPVTFTPPALSSGSFPASPQNYSSRKNTPIDHVVVHVTQGPKQAALYWFQSSASKVSAHYVIGQNGGVTQCVSESMNAWHAGNNDMNRRSIGIECEGYVTDPSMWTDALLGALTSLIRSLCDRYGIPVTRTRILGHSEVPGATHTDVGQYAPWDRIMAGISNAVVV